MVHTLLLCYLTLEHAATKVLILNLFPLTICTTSFDNSRVDRQMTSNEIIFMILTYPQLVDERSEEAVRHRKR